MKTSSDPTVTVSDNFSFGVLPVTQCALGLENGHSVVTVWARTRLFGQGRYSALLSAHRGYDCVHSISEWLQGPPQAQPE